MKTDWIALFKSDFTSKVFEEKVKSEDVMYWIKRYENGNTSTSKYAKLTKPLRSFEIYDTDFNATNLSYGVENFWQCLDLVETGHNNLGSTYYCHIQDNIGNKLKVAVGGFYSGHNGWNPHINENLYFTAIMLFLRMLNSYKIGKTWKLKI